jgi:large subunit ribosomal protein L25
MELNLQCQTRPSSSKPNSMRRSGQIPAVLYGHQGNESINLAIDAKAVELLIRDAAINNTLINITVSDISWKGKALLREVQTHPWKGKPYHLSFFAIGSHDSLDVVLPVHLVGEAPGVKVGGGTLDLQMNEMHIRCAPDKIPDVVEVSVEALELGGSLHVREVVLPTGVTVLDDPDQIVVLVVPPRTSEPEEATAAAAE